MIKYICDRCGKETDENYYTCAFGCMCDKQGMISTEGASFNTVENLRPNRMLCFNCINEIQTFADKKIYRQGECDERKNQRNTRESSKRNDNSLFRWYC